MTAELTAPLFEPISVRGMTIPNRTVMAPMGRMFAKDHVPSPDAPAYYRRRVNGGVGLVITEATGIDHPLSADHGGTPHMHGEAALQAWRAVVQDVHQAGGLIVPQLFHQGMLHGGGTPDQAVESLRPSGTIGTPGSTSFAPHYIERASVPTQTMTEGQIADVIARFARSARNAVALGFKSSNYDARTTRDPRELEAMGSASDTLLARPAVLARLTTSASVSVALIGRST